MRNQTRRKLNASTSFGGWRVVSVAVAIFCIDPIEPTTCKFTTRAGFAQRRDSMVGEALGPSLCLFKTAKEKKG